MTEKTFTPRYSPYAWSLILLYAAPWLLCVANALAGWTGADARLFALLASTAWLVLGLLHMKGTLLRRIRFSETIIVEMHLQRPAAQAASLGVRVRGHVVHFECRDVRLKYLSNADELMQIFVHYAGMGEMNLVYDGQEEKDRGWAAWKSLVCLGAFAVYMASALLLGLRPFRFVGPATDALLPVLGLLLVAGIAVWVVKKSAGGKSGVRWKMTRSN